MEPSENLRMEQLAASERGQKGWLESEQLRRIHICCLDSNYFQNYIMHNKATWKSILKIADFRAPKLKGVWISRFRCKTTNHLCVELGILKWVHKQHFGKQGAKVYDLESSLKSQNLIDHSAKWFRHLFFFF